jgi:hypothetical protein
MMINLDNVLELWEKDSPIDDTDLSKESKRSATLHQKYLSLYSKSKLQLKKAEMDQKILLKDKWLYYQGKMDQERMEELGWDPDPFDGLKIMKTDLDKWFESDKDLQASEAKIIYMKTVVETLKEITDSIKWRHMHIKNMIDWKRFEAGN